MATRSTRANDENAVPSNGVFAGKAVVARAAGKAVVAGKLPTKVDAGKAGVKRERNVLGAVTNTRVSPRFFFFFSASLMGPC